MKKILSFMLALVAALCFGLPSCAQAQHKVYDSAEVLSAQDEQLLEEMAEKLVLKHGVDAMICTERSLSTEPEERAKNLFSLNDAGVGNNHDGLLLLIWFENDMPNYVIYENGWTNEVFTEYIVERTDELVSKSIEKRDFAGAAEQLLKVSDKFMTAQEKGKPYSISRPYRTSKDYLQIWLFWLCIGAALSGVICYALVARMNKRSVMCGKVSLAPEKKSFTVTTQRDIMLYTKIRNDDGKKKLDE